MTHPDFAPTESAKAIDLLTTVRNKDVLYLSRHPATDFIKFVQIIRGPLAVARDVQLINNAAD